MENIEFIPAANLPETETSEVDVLCVENGELKRKPVANLGNSDYDMLIEAKITEKYIEDEGFWADSLNAVVISGNCADCIQKIKSRLPVIIRVIEDGTELGQNSDLEARLDVYDHAASWLNHFDMGEGLVVGGYTPYFVTPDNTIITNW